MKSGHYRRDQAYVDEYVNAGKMFVDKVDSKYNTADLGTKAVKPIELFEFLRDRMTGYDPEFYMSPRVKSALNHVLTITQCVTGKPSIKKPSRIDISRLSVSAIIDSCMLPR